MAYSMHCADTGTDCPGDFTTRSEEELMAHLQLLVSQAHPEMTLDDATVTQIKGFIRQS